MFLGLALFTAHNSIAMFLKMLIQEKPPGYHGSFFPNVDEIADEVSNRLSRSEVRLVEDPKL